MNCELPKAFYERMNKLLGDEFPAFCSSLEERPPTSLRINPYKFTDLSHISFQGKVPWDEYGFYILNKMNFLEDPLWSAGTYYVQSASSMSLTPFLKYIFENIGSSPLILDLAAAPGGKSLLTTSFMPSDAILISNEVNPKRVHILYENIAKWGHENVVVTRANHKQLSKLKTFFDVIILDAPCSAEGLFRKHKKYLQQWKPKNVYSSAKIQRQLLEASANMLAPNGFLIYATCTYSLEENEEQIRRFIEEFPEFEIININVPKEWNWTKTKITDDSYGYRLYPHKIKGEGFFIVLLQKTRGSKSKLNKITLKSFRGKVWNVEGLFEFRNGIYLDATKKVVEKLTNYKIPIYSAGLKIAEPKKKNLLPTTEFALWRKYNYFPEIPLTHQEALDFLRGKSRILKENYDAQYLTATYKNVPLGLYKNVGNRLNNMFPAYWRI